MSKMETRKNCYWIEQRGVSQPSYKRCMVRVSGACGFKSRRPYHLKKMWRLLFSGAT